MRDTIINSVALIRLDGRSLELFLKSKFRGKKGREKISSKLVWQNSNVVKFQFKNCSKFQILYNLVYF